jgi:hypothetical protein
MDAKQIARLLGALSIEERVQIIKCLLDAGPEGLQMLDIAAHIDLGAAAVFKQLESLAGLEIVFVKSVDNNKVYVANARQLDELFDYMHQHFGSGFSARKAAEAAAGSDGADAAGAA